MSDNAGVTFHRIEHAGRPALKAECVSSAGEVFYCAVWEDRPLGESVKDAMANAVLHALADVQGVATRAQARQRAA